jgi:ribosomal protein L37AE/L43A
MDRLGIALFIAYMALAVLSSILGSLLLYILSFAVFGYMIFRIFSRNKMKRTAENTKFLYGWYNFKNRWRLTAQRMRDMKTYRYLSCPDCRQKVRVPRGKGKVNITCPKCRAKFIRKV